MTVERSRDWKLIKDVVTSPAIYAASKDDFSLPREQWEPVQSEAVYYLVVRNQVVLGVFALIPENAICWQVHTCLLPIAYGPMALAAAQISTNWVWRNTPCLRIVTTVPGCNRLALRFARRSGMVEYGINPRSYMKDGKLHDQILLGISKPEVN